MRVSKCLTTGHSNADGILIISACRGEVRMDKVAELDSPKPVRHSGYIKDAAGDFLLQFLQVFLKDEPLRVTMMTLNFFSLYNISCGWNIKYSGGVAKEPI